jgi:hypothetical protein
MGKAKNAQGTVMRVWNYMGYQKAALMFSKLPLKITHVLPHLLYLNYHLGKDKFPDKPHFVQKLKMLKEL